jgi:hypothetical protein
MDNGEEHPGQDPQSDIRARIAEKYERARFEEMREQHEVHGLPLPEVDGFAEEGPTEAPVASVPQHEQQQPPPPQPAQPQAQLVPMGLPDGRVTYVTPDQYSQLAALGMNALARSQQPQQQPQYTPPPQQYAPPPRSAFSEERAGSIAQRLSFGTVDEQKQAVLDLAAGLQPQVDVETVRHQAATEVLQHLRLEQNLTTIGQEYPEIFQDPVLTQVAALQLDSCGVGIRGSSSNLISISTEQPVVKCVSGSVLLHRRLLRPARLCWNASGRLPRCRLMPAHGCQQMLRLRLRLGRKRPLRRLLGCARRGDRWYDKVACSGHERGSGAPRIR